MWRQQGRHRTGTTGGNSLYLTQQWMGNITEWSGYGYVEATWKAQDRSYWRQRIASDTGKDKINCGRYELFIHVVECRVPGEI